MMKRLVNVIGFGQLAAFAIMSTLVIIQRGGDSSAALLKMALLATAALFFIASGVRK